MLLFDMDGTLTEKRKPITPEMVKALNHLREPYSIVTGARIEHVVQQLGSLIPYEGATYIFADNGNAVYARSPDPIYLNVIDNLRPIAEWFEYIVRELPYRHQHSSACTENIIDIRHGMVNVSICGTGGDRDCFVQYDRIYIELYEQGVRDRLIDRARSTFPQFVYSIGGAVSIDVMLPHTTKAQVVNWLSSWPTIKFFGDGIINGNDRELAMQLQSFGHQTFQVEGPQYLLKLLGEYMT